MAAPIFQRAARKVKTLLPGYDHRNWLRIKQIQAFGEVIASRPLQDILEISPGWNTMWKSVSSKSYRGVDFPDFDICKDRLSEQFDIVIADQVLEHVAQPHMALANIHAMTRVGGIAMIATPFLFRVHARPHDYSRWTEAGLREVVTLGGFHRENITTGSWGNRACVRAHVGGPVRDFGFGRDLSNDPEYPIMVWAFAERRHG